MKEQSTSRQVEYVKLLTTNCVILEDVNVSAQLIFWRGLSILNESKLNLVDPDYYRKPGNYLRFLGLNYIKRKKLHISSDVIWVWDEWTINYYHWFVEALPRIFSTRMDLSRVVIVLPSSCKRSKFQEDSLNLLGIRYQYFDVTTERVHCDKLYLPLPVSITGTTNPPYMRKVRELLLKSIPGEERRNRLYITRRLAAKRKVSNENEIIAFMEANGFTIVEFENLSFLQQVSICRNADVIVGLHGAGLTNMVFMETGKIVVELRRENEVNFCFQFLAEALNLQYRNVECRNEGTDPENSDFYVNLPSLSNILLPLL